MVQDHIIRWVEALRSGDYKQAYEALRVEGVGYCCLGVYCDLVEPDGWEYNGIWYHTYTSNILPAHLCYEVETVLGNYEDLITMNDELRYNFTEIANELEYCMVHGVWTDDTISRLKDLRNPVLEKPEM